MWYVSVFFLGVIFGIILMCLMQINRIKPTPTNQCDAKEQSLRQEGKPDDQ